MSRFATQALVAECLQLIAPAEAAFRARWRMSTLFRVDEDLHARLLDQIDLYSVALIGGSSEELKTQAAAMVRGWAAACICMEQHPDDAYLVGFDRASATQVVISDHKGSVEHVEPCGGFRVIAVSPDEVAKLLGDMTIVRETKHAFPDAEIVGVEMRSGDAA